MATDKSAALTILTDRVGHRPMIAGRRTHAHFAVWVWCSDALLILLSGLAAIAGRNHLVLFHNQSISLPMGVPAGIAVAWVALIAAFGGYRNDVFGAGTDEFKRVTTASLYTAGLLGICCYLTKFDLSRGFFLLAFLVGTPAVAAGRVLLRQVLHTARVRGAIRQRVAIVGAPANVDEISAVLHRERWLGYDVVGAVTGSEHGVTRTQGGVPVLGHVDSTDDLIHVADAVDALFLTGGSSLSAEDIRQLQWDLEHLSVDLVIAPSLTEIAGDRIRVRPVGGLPLMHLERPRWAAATRGAKRAFDLVCASLLIALLSPLIAFAALRIRRYDGGPVLFRQTRVGRDGELFSCFKFRTMVVDAEARVAQLREELGASALLFKMKDDPRITKPGAWLRRFSIDELPQLFNVVRGEMSLVGPRPQVPAEVELYDDALRRRLHVRPGMTGLWQVSGRNDLSVEDSVRLDLYYVDNWSMLQDLSILGRTVRAVVSSKGAY